MRHSVVFLLCSILSVGCDTGGRIPTPDGSTPADSGPVDSGVIRDSGPPVDAGGRLDDVLIYAHSEDTLYEFSPFSNTVTELGVFDVEDGSRPNMLDLAVDADGLIVTVGFNEIYVVDPETMETLISFTYREDRDPDVDPLFGLSFIPSDLSPSGQEILIGATNSGDLFEVDLRTARLTPRGRYPDNWGSSGDITAVSGLGVFATLRQRDADGRPIEGEPDAVAEITIPASGNATVRIIGTTRTESGETFTKLFGLGYWGRNLFGFTSEGQLLRIDRETAISTVVSSTTGAMQFYGAGVTTKVPFLE